MAEHTVDDDRSLDQAALVIMRERVWGLAESLWAAERDRDCVELLDAMRMLSVRVENALAQLEPEDDEAMGDVAEPVRGCWGANDRPRPAGFLRTSEGHDG